MAARTNRRARILAAAAIAATLVGGGVACSSTAGPSTSGTNTGTMPALGGEGNEGGDAGSGGGGSGASSTSLPPSNSDESQSPEGGSVWQSRPEGADSGNAQ